VPLKPSKEREHGFATVFVASPQQPSSLNLALGLVSFDPSLGLHLVAVYPSIQWLSALAFCHTSGARLQNEALTARWNDNTRATSAPFLF
jgi:hypothetical protein